MILALKTSLISLTRNAEAIGILSSLPPAGKLFGVEATLLEKALSSRQQRRGAGITAVK
jgi:hypothetical protein